MNDSDIRSRVHQYLIQKTNFLKIKDTLSEDQLRIFVDKAITDICYEEDLEMSMEIRISLIRSLVSAVISMGPIRPLMEDKTITEIMVNGSDKIYVQKEGKIHLTDIKFENNNTLLHTVQKLLVSSGSSRRVDESSPYVDFSLGDGSRVNVILPPCSLVGPVLTIRKFSSDINTVEDLINRKMFNDDMAEMLIASMHGKLNIVFCGATGTGKTTALNVLSRHIDQEERIITIEDTPELRLMQEHVVTLQSKSANIEGKGVITIRDLFVNSLRMRPDRIIIGEVRSDEMLDLIQSISSGHTGSLAIVHADSPEDCFNRMVTMMMMAGIQLSTEEIRKQVARAIDLIVHIELFPDGVRRITYLTDSYFDGASGQIKLEDVFKFVQDELKEDGKIIGHWEKTKKKPYFFPKLVKRHVYLSTDFFDK